MIVFLLLCLLFSSHRLASDTCFAGFSCLFASFVWLCSALLHLTFWCFVVVRSWHPTHRWFVRCVYMCVFAFLGLQATCTAARNGSLCMVLRVFGGQVIATLVARRALFFAMFDDIVFPLPMQVLWSMAGSLPLCLLWDLHCTPSGVVILCPPVCCVAVRLVCTCLILRIVFGFVWGLLGAFWPQHLFCLDS